MVTIEPPFEINISKWEGENLVEVELVCDGELLLFLSSFNNMKEAREFVKKLQKANIKTYIVKEDGSIKGNN